MQGLLDIEEQCRGFLELAKSATALLVKSIFSDTAFVDLFSKICCSDDWKQGATAGSILATLGDYLGDFKRLLEESFYKRSACTVGYTSFGLVRARKLCILALQNHHCACKWQELLLS